MDICEQILVGKSLSILKVRELVRQVANSDLNIIISGESGVGKELVAQGLHLSSNRKGKPFVKVNCAAIPSELLESELFGYERGAFTGADRTKPGKFELAHSGTIFLDEIGDMPLFLQSKMLQVLQDFQFSRLGAKNDVKVNCWVLAATNHDIEQDVREGLFREDLYYRLNVVSIQVPPLRDRMEDLTDLVRHLVGRINSLLGTSISSISGGAFGVLSSYDWPGNVRELQNVLERAAILGEGSVISEQDVRIALRETFAGVRAAKADPDEINIVKGEKVCLKEVLHKMEKNLILVALSKTSCVQAEAAGMLGVTPKNLWKKIQKHSIKLGRLKAAGEEK